MNMADERRRELRRRRILENSEARREKIFNITKSAKLSVHSDDETYSGNVPVTPAFATSTPLLDGNNGIPNIISPQISAPSKTLKSPTLLSDSAFTPLSSRETTAGKFSEGAARDVTNRNGAFSEARLEGFLQSSNGLPQNRIPQSKLVDDPRLSNESDFTLRSSFEAVDRSSPSSITSNSLWIPFILALLACFFIYSGLGHVVSHSISLPILLYELQNIARTLYNQRKEPESNNAGLLGTAVVLCGVSPVAVARCLNSLHLIREVSGSFAVYLVTVVVWQTCLGLPEDVESIPVEMT